jgi:hypothetical protein
LATALVEIERLLAGPDVDRRMEAWGQVVDACRSALTPEANGLLLEELRLAAHVRANGSDLWNPPPSLGTLLRLARLNVTAALRKAEEG